MGRGGREGERERIIVGVVVWEGEGSCLVVDQLCQRISITSNLSVKIDCAGRRGE